MNVFSTPLRKKCTYSELFWSAFFTHFPAFELNTERYGEIFSPNAGKCVKNADQNNSEYGLFLRSALISRSTKVKEILKDQSLELDESKNKYLLGEKSEVAGAEVRRACFRRG